MSHHRQPWAKKHQKNRLKKRFLSRMQAQRLLQVDSMNFRRLCILKGIYPRSMAKSKAKDSGNEKQYFLTKEVKWLARDDVAQKGHAFRAWEKKMRRARAQRDKRQQKSLRKRWKPSYKLDATIRERYPTFADALKDVDDAMSMIYLFAFLPPEINSRTTIDFHRAHTSGLSERSQEIVQRWCRYIERSKGLSKGFISIKGYYFEVVVDGQKTLFLAPHEYTAKFPRGVQQYMLLTFLEFYLELMKFVLFKLEREVDEAEDRDAKIEEEGDDPNVADFDDEKKAKNAKKAGPGNEAVSRLFSGFVFYISREVPRKHIEFVTKCMGASVTTTAGPHVTHYIIDRPKLMDGQTKIPNVEYLQPQYVIDCLNARFVLPVDGYRLGETLPPHVSPFTVSITNTASDNQAVDEVKRYHPKLLDYTPERVHEIRKLVDPNYVPEQKRDDYEMSDSDDDIDRVQPEMDSGDEVELSGDEMEAARKRPRWEDEGVSEHVARTKASELRVKKQREMNLMNKPTDEAVASRRADKKKRLVDKIRSETREQRLERKRKEAKAQEKTQKKMNLQVAHKKASRFYKMINGVLEKNDRKVKGLQAKAERLQEGKAVPSSDGTAIRSVPKGANAEKVAKGKAKVTNRADPYKKLPKWVR